MLLQLVYCVKVNAQTVIFHEAFDSLNVELANGWKAINKSNPLGTGQWLQGNSFSSAYNGPSTSYAEVNYTSTDSVGTISNWLLTDTMTLENNDTVTFYTLSYNAYLYRDNLECRLSAMDTSHNVGANDTTVGDFSTLIVAVNPNYDSLSYPSILGSGSLHTWKQFKGAVSGLSAPTKCRLAFRYYVPNGGYAGAHSSTIGIDELNVIRYVPAGISENAITFGVQLFPNPAKENINLRFNKSGNYKITIFNSVGQNVLSFKSETGRTIDISSLAPSLYTVQIIDLNSGTNKSTVFIKQ